MEKKQLIIVVEGTATMGPYWQTIFFDYLEKIIRSLSGNELHGQKASTSSVELSLVTFYAHGSNCDSLVLRSGWTKDVDSFLQWLSAIQFGGGSFSDVAIAKGLSEALMMFPIAPNGNQFQQNVSGQRHCILVAASNPHPTPTLAYRPQMQNLEAWIKSHLFDAETVARLFAQSSISLSIICPRQLPKLRAIYDAGKCNPQAANPVVDNVKNPHFLVLISENFLEARVALSPHKVTSLASNQSLVKMDKGFVPAVRVPPPTFMSSGMPQQVQPRIQSLGVSSKSAANMILSPHISSTLQSEQSNYVKVWEENLSGQKQEQSVYITRKEDMVELESQISSQQHKQQQLQQQQHQQMQSQLHSQQQPQQYIEISDDESTELEMTNMTAPVEDLASAVKSMREEALSLDYIHGPRDNGSKMLLDFIERFVKKFSSI